MAEDSSKNDSSTAADNQPPGDVPPRVWTWAVPIRLQYAIDRYTMETKRQLHVLERTWRSTNISLVTTSGS